MTKTYAQIKIQIDKLKAEADTLRQREIDGVVARIKEAIEHYGLTAEELGLGAQGRGKKTRGTAKASRTFADGQGNTWGGRGPRPQWLRDALAQGHALDEFAIGGANAADVRKKAPGSPRATAADAAPKRRAAAKGVKAAQKAPIAAKGRAASATRKKTEASSAPPAASTEANTSDSAA